MKAYEIANIIEEYAPKELCETWDNVGFMLGDRNREVRNVFLTLDVTSSVMTEAMKANAQMVISHHPMFFEPIKRIDTTTSFGKMIEKSIFSNIVVYSAHTNLDCAEKGINSTLAMLFSIVNPIPLKPCDIDPTVGIGRMGSLKQPCTLSELANRAKLLLSTPYVRASGNMDKEISTIAVASGSCGDLIPLAIKNNIDAIVTSDIKYHEAKTYTDLGIGIIDAGHYPTEKICTNIFKKYLKNCDLDITVSQDMDVFNYI